MTAKDPADIREAVLKAALPEIDRDGFTDDVLTRAGRAAGFKPIEVNSAFPSGAAGLVEEFSNWADARMASRMKRAEEKGTRARVTAAVRARLEAMAPHKEAARRAAFFLAMPQNAVLATRLLYRTVDAMWRAAGDRSTDFSFYTKRATLAGVYGATLLYWLGDTSEDHRNTWPFLHHRISDVMSFEKFKQTAREAFAQLPDPFGLFSAWRPGTHDKHTRD
ncbi:MAG: COQ9 family protein [Alphaproteobacteria bacterium]